MKTQTLLSKISYYRTFKNFTWFIQDYNTDWKSLASGFWQKKSENFLNEKNVKIKKQAHAFKVYASSYNINFVYIELSKKDFILMSIWVILKGLKKNSLVKKVFLVPWSAEKLLTKNMNVFLIFE